MRPPRLRCDCSLQLLRHAPDVFAHRLAKGNPTLPATKSNEKYVFGILILGAAALAIYQLFFCASCY
jgi:hypothetical protein